MLQQVTIRPGLDGLALLLEDSLLAGWNAGMSSAHQREATGWVSVAYLQTLEILRNHLSARDLQVASRVLQRYFRLANLITTTDPVGLWQDPHTATIIGRTFAVLQNFATWLTDDEWFDVAIIQVQQIFQVDLEQPAATLPVFWPAIPPSIAYAAEHFDIASEVLSDSSEPFLSNLDILYEAEQAHYQSVSVGSLDAFAGFRQIVQQHIAALRRDQQAHLRRAMMAFLLMEHIPGLDATTISLIVQQLVSISQEQVQYLVMVCAQLWAPPVRALAGTWSWQVLHAHYARWLRIRLTYPLTDQQPSEQDVEVLETDLHRELSILKPQGQTAFHDRYLDSWLQVHFPGGQNWMRIHWQDARLIYRLLGAIFQYTPEYFHAPAFAIFLRQLYPSDADLIGWLRPLLNELTVDQRHLIAQQVTLQLGNHWQSMQEGRPMTNIQRQSDIMQQLAFFGNPPPPPSSPRNAASSQARVVGIHWLTLFWFSSALLNTSQ